MKWNVEFMCKNDYFVGDYVKSCFDCLVRVNRKIYFDYCFCVVFEGMFLNQQDRNFFVVDNFFNGCVDE